MRASWRIEQVLLVCLFAAYSVAMYAYLVHALATNPQYDNHVLWYTADFEQSLLQGKLSDFLFQSHKYPLLYILQFALVKMSMTGFSYLVDITFTNPAMYLAGRIWTFLYAIGTLILTGYLSQKLTHTRWALLLLLCSPVFFLLSTAVRPHIPVAFWTIMCLLLSMRMQEHRSVKNTILAWGAAVIAFATLQSGIFAFIFPCFVQLSQSRDWKQWVKTGSLLVCCVSITVVIGYPFVLGAFFGMNQEVSVDLGHNVGFSYDLARGFRTIGIMLGSEIVLLAFAAAGFVLALRKKTITHSMWLAIYMYIVLFTAAFLFHNASTPRFFLPVLPLLAVMGAPVLHRLPMWVRSIVWVFMTVVFIKLALLASVPNTYQQVSSFVAKQEGKIAIHVSIPSYFTTIPEDRFPLEKDDTDFSMAVVTDMALQNSNDLGTIPYKWKRCGHFVASPTTDEIVLLWNDETPWALYEVFKSNALGPNISVYCL